MINKLLSRLISGAVKYYIRHNTGGLENIFNSIRINALVTELERNGKIDRDNYEKEVERLVSNIFDDRSELLDG